MFLRHTFQSILITNLVIYSVLYFGINEAYRQKTVYQKITSEENLSTLNSLIQNSSLAKRAILYWNTTVFAPKNEAFENFNGKFTIDLIYYHVSNELKSLRMIFESNNLHTLADGYPPLWITKVDADIYVNNAKILMSESDYFSTAIGRFYNHNQALHIIDEVLEPPSVHLDNPTALDLISNNSEDDIYCTKRYMKRINDLSLKKLFKTGSNTYFVPVDIGFNNYREKMTDKYIIDGHIIQNQVLFTRPTIKNFYFETRANEDYIYILVSFVEKDGKMYVKSNTVLGDSSHQKGELLTEVLKANIPVKNGVVHYIRQPLGVFDMEAKPFPYLPILSKLSADPDLNITFQLAENTKFNEHLKNSHSLLTFFVPRNSAWKKHLDNLTTENRDEQLKLLGRHLVISDVRYTIQRLWYRSIDRIITLNTVGGPIDVKIVKDDNDNYNILYENKVINVYRPNYICTNGIIHIIDEPFVPSIKDDYRRLKMDFWKSLEDLIF